MGAVEGVSVLGSAFLYTKWSHAIGGNMVTRKQ